MCAHHHEGPRRPRPRNGSDELGVKPLGDRAEVADNRPQEAGELTGVSPTGPALPIAAVGNPHDVARHLTCAAFEGCGGRHHQVRGGHQGPFVLRHGGICAGECGMVVHPVVDQLRTPSLGKPHRQRPPERQLAEHHDLGGAERAHEGAQSVRELVDVALAEGAAKRVERALARQHHAAHALCERALDEARGRRSDLERRRHVEHGPPARREAAEQVLGPLHPVAPLEDRQAHDRGPDGAGRRKGLCQTPELRLVEDPRFTWAQPAQQPHEAHAERHREDSRRNRASSLEGVTKPPQQTRDHRRT